MNPARLFRRVVYWWRFRSEQVDLRDELELHRELLAESLQRRGLAAEDARVAARRAMGNETLMREEARGVWLAFGLESVLKDWRYAWRGLLRSPAFSLLVVLMVALTIAANTVVFSVVQHVLLDPLPYPDGNRIVRLGAESVADPLMGQLFGISTELLRRLRARSRTLDEFAAVNSGERYRIGSDPEEPAVTVASITPSFLPMLRVRPVLGRGFTVDDARWGAAPVMMIGFGVWQLRYGGARSVIGKVVSVNGAPRTIVGVVPEGFDIPISLNDTPQLWLPLNIGSLTNVAGAFARLRKGATSTAASRELQAIMAELPDTGSMKGYRMVASTAQDRIDPRDKHALELLFVTVCGLLLMACANIANLLLMRGWRRQREIAIRLALGAGRLRLARQLLHLPGVNGDLFNLQMYRPTSATSEFVSNIVLRMSRSASALEPTLRKALEGAGTPAKLERVRMTESVVDGRFFARPRFVLMVFGVFAMIALALSAAGLYGIIAYAVTQRTREIGVRVALGAEPLAVAHLVLVDSVRLLTIGAGLGLLGAYAGSRLLAGFLYQVSPTDPMALGGAVLLMTMVALVATLVPLRRALQIDPVDALRAD